MLERPLSSDLDESGEGRTPNNSTVDFGLSCALGEIESESMVL